MNKFYFFKVDLSYFDDARKTFFITPDQSETDEDGIPFSENDLRNTAEFREFVKKTKADVIDVDYIEYAVEYDPKKSVILGTPITEESFSTLENGKQLEIVDQNQFPIIIKKSSKGGGSKNYIFFLIAAAVIALIVLVIGAEKGGFFGVATPGNESSGTLDVSEPSESESLPKSDDTGISDGESSYTSIESSNSENTHEPTSEIGSDNSDTSGDDSVPDSSDNPENSSGEDSSDDTSKDESAESPDEFTNPIFNLDRTSNMAVTIFFDGDEPEVSFIDPHGEIIAGSEYTADHRTDSACYYLENAEPGQWHVSCDKPFAADWQPYVVLPDVGE